MATDTHRCVHGHPRRGDGHLPGGNRQKTIVHSHLPNGNRRLIIVHGHLPNGNRRLIIVHGHFPNANRQETIGNGQSLLGDGHLPPLDRRGRYAQGRCAQGRYAMSRAALSRGPYRLAYQKNKNSGKTGAKGTPRLDTVATLTGSFISRSALKTSGYGGSAPNPTYKFSIRTRVRM
uniref:Uncharacterized protein n=1 Tax=Candidatus Kentrum sp. UNK TaxID=2126344 RepID=A0A451AIP1_9GAMM|nr:MAG: hypothetical protein BECKUNK1418G_GA0071005_107214 [Candidatus Kentron sp. UNK]VFK69639.1 MAG: hypothetical protein BECKUNK1418H_GA0071006_101714 [Candidatus Kentron sp. UNK]